MAYFTRTELAITATTAQTTGVTNSINGILYGVHYSRAVATPFSSSNLITIFTGHTTDPIVLKFAPTTATHLEFFPRSKIHTSTGQALSLSTALFFDGVCHVLANDSLKVRVSNSSGGSATKNGTLDFIIQGAG